MSVAQRFKEIREGFEMPFWVANGTELFERLAYYGPSAVMAIYLHEHLGLTSEQSTWLIGYYGFIVWFMPVLGGALADRFGFRRTLTGAFMILAVGYFLLGSLSAGWMAPVRGALPLFALMHILMLVPALGPAVVKPVVVGTTARAAHENVRSLGYSIYYTVVNIGAAIGPLAASFVRTSVGVENVFLVSAGLTFAMAIVTLLFFKEPGRLNEPQTASVAAAFGNLVKVLGNVRFVVFLLIFSGFWVTFWQQYMALPIYVRDYVNRDANVDRLLSVEATTVILTTFLATYLMRKVPAFTAIIIGVLLSSLSWLVLTIGAATPYIVAALIILALGEVIQAPRYYEYMSRLAPPGQQGLFMGYAFLPIGIGYLIGGRTAGWLLHHFGEVLHKPAQMWYVVSGVGLLTGALLIVYNRVVKPGDATAGK
ncbi:MAG: MFS transporter [Gemmatimonadota bacterium]